MEAFKYNYSVMSEEDQLSLKELIVGVVGLGGLGGFVASSLVRLGVTNLVLYEPDQFETSNLNRQLYATRETLGKSKLKTTIEALKKINPELVIEEYLEKFDEHSGPHVNVMFDCLDSIQDRLILEDYAVHYGIPLIHGAVSAWYGQVAIISGEPFLHRRYQDATSASGTSPTFTVPIVANMMVAEFLKYYQGTSKLINKMLVIDLLRNDISVL